MLTLPRGDPRLTPPRWAGLVLAIPFMSSTPGLIIACAIAVFIVGSLILVVYPAVWSKNEKRREDAKEVLGIIRKDRSRFSR